MSRGTTRRMRLRPADADGSEELPVGDEREAVRAARRTRRSGCARRAATRARRRRAREACTTAAGWPASPSSSARRGAWSQARTIRAPVVCASGRPPSRAAPTRRRQPGSRQPNRSPELRPPAAIAVSCGAPTPRSARASGAAQPRLPVARRRGTSTGQSFGSSPASIELGAALVRLAPQELGRLGEVAGLVEDEQRRRVEVVERRSPAPGDAGPDLGRVAHVERPRRPVADRGRGRRSVRPSPSNRARSAARRSGSFAAPRPRRPRSAATPPRGSRNSRRRQEDGLVDRADGPLVGRVERAQRVDLVAEELDPDRQRRRRREDVDDAAAPGELAAAGDLETGT